MSVSKTNFAVLYAMNGGGQEEFMFLLCLSVFVSVTHIQVRMWRLKLVIPSLCALDT